MRFESFEKLFGEAPRHIRRSCEDMLYTQIIRINQLMLTGTARFENLLVSAATIHAAINMLQASDRELRNKAKSKVLDGAITSGEIANRNRDDGLSGRQ